MPEINVKKTIR